jgi:signal transduction histidine kinase
LIFANLIKDIGIGISQDTIDKLFKIDCKITSQGTNGEKGTGLGLILCKEFIERNGGKL